MVDDGIPVKAAGAGTLSIAVAEQLVQGVIDLGVTPRANPDPRKARVTLRDLLANESGFACDDRDGASPGNESKLYDTSDWVQAFADLPIVAAPGTLGRYCSFGFKTAGRLVERPVGRPLAEFAQQALFDP